MANKRVSSEDLVLLQVHITPTQKLYLDTLDSSKSRTVRELIDGHKSRFSLDLKRLYQRKKELETELAIVANEIKIREEEIRQENEKRNEFETVKKSAVRILLRKYKEHSGDFRKFVSPLQTWAEALQISQSDLEKIIIDAVSLEVE